jgi:mannose-6-phosphate isomerase-like protein (cupin superfamily)
MPTEAHGRKVGRVTESGAAFDPAHFVATLYHDGTSAVVDPTENWPPVVRIDGFTVGAPLLSVEPSPHNGELHPDGDELLYLVAGRIAVVLDDGDQDHVGTERVEQLEAGQAFIVPKGTWHRIDVLEPGRLVHVTPGPGSAHRPL